MRAPGHAEADSAVAARWLDALRRPAGDDRPAVVALDLDLTLADNTPRTRRILAEFALEAPEALRPEVSPGEALRRADTGELVFSILENLGRIGVAAEAARELGIPFWRQRFFADRYCDLDLPYPDAAPVARALHERGVHVAYVTARLAPTQAEGTVRWLRAHRFPVCVPFTSLLMKPTAEEPDGAYKGRACEALGALGRVAVAVDNEPGHCNTFATAFPGALVYCIQTRHSPHAPALRPEVSPLAGWTALRRALDA